MHPISFARTSIALLPFFHACVLAFVAHSVSAQVSAGKQTAKPFSQTLPTSLSAETAHTADWLESVSSRIHQGEYRFTENSAGVWSAPNRSQQLRSSVSAMGIKVSPRTVDANWQLNLTTSEFGRVGNLHTLPTPALTAMGQRLELDHHDLVEWFVNDRKGIEQGWTISVRPAGSAALAIGLTITEGYSLHLNEDARSGFFAEKDGKCKVNYVGLVAWDAKGQDLPVRLISTPGGAEVHVDDTDASYPLTVDPLIVNADWTASGDQIDAAYGVTVASAGDVNADGFDDIIVGAPSYDLTQFNQGRVYIYHGSASGVSSSPAWVQTGATKNGGLGFCVASAGDVNADGFDDVIIGVTGVLFGSSGLNTFRVYLGSSTGVSSTASQIVTASTTGSALGYSLASAGDVNGDGYADVIVGEPFVGGGRVYIHHGCATGIETTPARTGFLPAAFSFFGIAVDGAGDVNGDGYDDVIIGANPDVVFVFHGSANGVRLQPAWSSSPPVSTVSYGRAVSSAGDVNGDGYDDVIIGEFSGATGGNAYVYHGSATGLGAQPVWTVTANQPVAQFGFSVSDAGDLNADGFSDVVVGAKMYRENPANSGSGRAFVYYGSPLGLNLKEAWMARPFQDITEFGTSVAGAGDVNGDGFDDLIVGDPGYNEVIIDDGRVSIYHGFFSPLATGVVYNGSGSNALCFSSEAPIIGSTWDSIIDPSVRTSPTFAVMVVNASSAAGTFLPGGELLVDLGSPRYATIQAAASGATVQIAAEVPASLALVGLTATAQGVVFGAGYTLCNAFSFSIGF